MKRPVNRPPALQERYQALGKMRLANLGIERHDEKGGRFNLARALQISFVKAAKTGEVLKASAR